jgi:hypothetical protein
MRALRSKKAADNGCRMRMGGSGVRLRKGSDEAAATIRQSATIGMTGYLRVENDR